MITENINLMQAALSLAMQQGLPVFPCGKDKKPLTPHGFKDATTAPDTIRQWWTRYPDALIGIPLGAITGVFALDTDLPEGPASLARLEEQYGILPATLEQRTGSGGNHKLFKHPGATVKNSSGKIGTGLDIRGDGGYIIAAPSPGYTWSNSLLIAEAPAWLLEKITERPAKVAAPVTTGTPYGLKALESELDDLKATTEGGRNARLNQAAFASGQLSAGEQLDREYAAAELLAAALKIGLPRADSIATIKSGMIAGFKEPRKPSPPSSHVSQVNSGSSQNIKKMSDLLNTSFAAIRWVIYGLLPEGLGILSGPPKIGKSWLVMNICIAKSIGGFVLGKFKVDAAEVLLLSLEDNERRLQGRLKKCLNGESHDLSKFHAVVTWRRLDQGGLDDLANWLEQHPDCCLVVIDTIQKIKAHARKNTNAYEADYEVYGDLQRLALKHCCCILVIHHNRKSASQNNDDPLEQISGSTGITGSMDTILMLRRPRGATGAVLTATGRDIPEAEYAMKFDGEMGQWIIDGNAAELTLGDGSHDILDVLKNHTGHTMTVAEVNSLLPEPMKEPYLKTKLYRLANKGILTAVKGKFIYINTDTNDTRRYLG